MAIMIAFTGMHSLVNKNGWLHGCCHPTCSAVHKHETPAYEWARAPCCRCRATLLSIAGQLWYTAANMLLLLLLVVDRLLLLLLLLLAPYSCPPGQSVLCGLPQSTWPTQVDHQHLLPANRPRERIKRLYRQAAIGVPAASLATPRCGA